MSASSPGPPSHSSAPPISHRTRGAAGWALPATLVAVILALQATGEPALLGLRYERAAVIDGQVWRLLTAHLVHLDWAHALLNAAALLLCCYILPKLRAPGALAMLLLPAALAVSGGLLLLDPNIAWYVGLSGVLHGLLAGGALAERGWLRWALLAILGLKLAYEQGVGPEPVAEALVGGRVILEAHAYGTAGGVVGALVQAVVRSRHCRIRSR